MSYSPSLLIYPVPPLIYQGETTSNIRLTEIVFIMVLLLWKDTMTKTTYKRKPFIGASIQFHGEHGNSQAGMVQEQ